MQPGDMKQVHQPNFLVIKSHGPDNTLRLGSALGEVLKSGSVVALVGQLGAGKTWLAKGIAFGLGVPRDEYVNSPAFDLVHQYQGQIGRAHV